jgi:hypothetical protein
MKFKKSLLALLIASVCFTAQAANEILVNEYIKAGVNESTGTLGSGGNTKPGIQYDNTGTGTFNPSYDYLTPGSPYEGWAVRIDNTDGTKYKLYGNNNAGFQSDGNTAVTGAWVGTPTAGSAVWAGSATEFDIRHTYSLPSAQKYLDITTRLDAKEAMPHLYFGRYIDPDAVATPGDSSATDNVRGYGIIPKSNVVFSEATVSRYALGLYSASPTGVNTSIQGWTSDPKNYYLNTSGRADVSTGDDTIGIAFYAANVAVGDILTWNYAYIFGPSAFSAADYAITGGAGGGTAGTSSFGTLVDVGSATDAGSGTTTPAAPTITSTSTATITVSDTTAVNTSLPVITASLAHHNASEASGKQTIARETTTNVTTPYTRSITTLVRTTNTWSDGTTTTSDSATSTDNTLINNVATTVDNASFSGRVDQMSYLNNLNKQLDRGLNMDAFRTDGYTDQEKKITMYVNASGAKSNIDNGYNAKSQIYGLGVEKEIEPNWRLGAQYNRVNTTMDGTDSKTAQDKNHAGLFSVYTLENDVKIVNNLGYADNTVKGNRTVEGVFNNSHSTGGDNVWLNNRVYAPETKGFRPYAGVTVGKSTSGAYTEAGDIQSARTVGKQVDNYSYGEAGVRYEKAIDQFRLMGDISTTTDSVTTGAATVAYSPTKNGTIALTAATQHGNNINTNTLSLRGIIKF